jgi:serine phosphatase RsbU (regulator of sigma subunit)
LLRALALAAGLLLVALGDWATGEELSLSFGYALVIMLAGWYQGWKGAFLATLAASLLHLETDVLLGTDRASLVETLARLDMAVLWLTIGLTAHVLARQSGELARANARFEEELRLARRVQNALIPARLPLHPALEGALRYQPSRAVGGDFLDVSLEGSHLVIWIGDVSGKGPPASLITGFLRGSIEQARGRRQGPAQALGSLNAACRSFLPEDMFITCFHARLDLETGDMLYASAGHDPPLVAPAGEGPVAGLLLTGMPLGIADEPEIEEARCKVAPGDTLLFYTDGLVNALGPRGERLGDQPVGELLAGHREASCQELAERLLDLASRPDDDICLLVLRRRQAQAG